MLEAGGASLEDSVALFQEGSRLCREAEALLDRAEALLNAESEGALAPVEWLTDERGQVGT